MGATVNKWLLAMLAPKGALCVAPVPPQEAALLTSTVRGSEASDRPERKNRRYTSRTEKRV